jgi:nucleotide-binding universal stress UspA family protein
VVRTFARIVVGVDGTNWGFEALRQALLLADESATIRAITAVDTSAAVHAGFRAAHFADLLEREGAEAQRKAEEIIDGRSGADARVLHGKPAEVLRRERDELDATLVALGGRRSSRFLGIMLGDTGTELVHDGVCSVLLAYPAREGAWEPRRIVVGMDSSSYALAALRAANEIAERCGGSVEVVSATGGKPVEREGAWAEHVQTWDEGHPVTVLVDRSKEVDLVVVGSRGLHGVAAIGSVSERLARQAHCTALIVHDSSHS